MGMEGRNFPDLCRGQPHLFLWRVQMGGRRMATRILDQAQELNQRILPPGPVAQKCPHLGQGRIVKLPSLGHGPTLPPPGSFPGLLIQCHARSCAAC
mgnify:CR=1 FL=1|jgi:hypothetical protein